MKGRSKPLKGGGVQDVLQRVQDTPLTPTIINPSSRFVVITYWWGRGNANKNLQRPCPEEIRDEIKEAMEGELAEEDDEFKAIYERVGNINKVRRERQLTADETKELKTAYQSQLAYTKAYFAKPETKDQFNERYAEAVNTLKQGGTFVESVQYEHMIENWKASCIRLLPEPINDYNIGPPNLDIKFKGRLEAKPLHEKDRMFWHNKTFIDKSSTKGVRQTLE